MEYSTQLFTGRSPPSFGMLCALKNYVEKTKKVSDDMKEMARDLIGNSY